MFCKIKYKYSPQMPAAFTNSPWVMLHNCKPLILKWEKEMQLASSLYWSQQNCSHSQTLCLLQYSGWMDVQKESETYLTRKRNIAMQNSVHFILISVFQGKLFPLPSCVMTAVFLVPLEHIKPCLLHFSVSYCHGLLYFKYSY